MTSFENPKAIRHFQSICDNLQDLVTRFHTPSDLKLYSDGYLQALRNCNGLEQNDQEKLEKLILLNLFFNKKSFIFISIRVYKA